jgi:RHS repeat-associated protein
VQELDGASPANVTANLLTGLNIDEYFARADSNGAMNFLTDAMGSTLALADSSGAINTSYTYEPFGNTSTNGSNPYQFTGRENDGTGLYFYRARYYSPTFQRFIAQDPLDFRGGDTNLYAYALNSPVSFRDPLGACAGTPHSPCLSLAGAAYITGVTAASIWAGARLGGYWGAWMGVWVGQPEAGWALGVLGGEGYGAYKAYGLIQLFCGW